MSSERLLFPGVLFVHISSLKCYTHFHMHHALYMFRQFHSPNSDWRRRQELQFPYLRSPQQLSSSTRKAK